MSDFFQNRLRCLRDERSSAEFARFLGIPAPMYHRYERGQVPKEKNLPVIADRCGVTVDWLLGRTDEGGPAVGAGAGPAPPAVKEERAAHGLVGVGVGTEARLASLESACQAVQDELSEIRRILISLLAEERRRADDSEAGHGRKAAG